MPIVSEVTVVLFVIFVDCIFCVLPTKLFETFKPALSDNTLPEPSVISPAALTLPFQSMASALERAESSVPLPMITALVVSEMLYLPRAV